MGKKVKKVVKTVGKIATLGAIDGSKGGWLGGTKGVTNIFSLGTVGEGPIPNVVRPPVPDAPDMSGLERALQAQAMNANVDLGLDNVADVVAGGTAEAQSGTRRRRSNAAGGVASSLGVRV